MFAREGYNGTALASIADAVDLTLPGLLHHFPSKEDLFVAVLDERDRRANEEFDSTVEHGSPTYFGSLEALVERNVAQREMVKLFTVLVGYAAVSEDNPGHAHFVERYAETLERICVELELLRKNGALRSDLDVETAARLIIAVMDGLQVQWLLDPSVDMQAAFHALTELLLPEPTKTRARANARIKRSPRAGK
jgi:AcrR family transcriptional regulator